MGYKKRNLIQPLYDNNKLKEPKKVFLIACEGNITEPQYFNLIKNKISLHSLVEIKVIERDDTNSSPKYILENLNEYLDDYDLKLDYDEAWMIVDRDIQNNSRELIEKIIKEVKEKGYNLGLSNPLFELWLLMHIININKYNFNELMENKKVTTKRRFIDNELSRLLAGNGGYNKKRLNENIITLDNIKYAISQSDNIEVFLDKILDNLGTNIGVLVEKIVFGITK